MEIGRMRRKIRPEDFYWNRDAVENWIYKNQDLSDEIFKNIKEKIRQELPLLLKTLKGS